MKRLVFGASVAAAFALTGCSSTAHNTGTPTDTATAAPTPTATVTPVYLVPSPTVPADIFDENYFPEYELIIPPASWNALQVDPRTYVSATFRHNGVAITNIGAKLKGRWGSFRDLERKSAFSLKFDHFVAGQYFHGFDHLTLNNGAQDPSGVHERTTYLIFRSIGVPAPKCNNCKLYVNGSYWGVMVQLETVKKQFLTNHFTDDTGNLYEGDPYDAFLPALAGGWPPNFGAVQWNLLDDILPGHESNFTLHTNTGPNNRSDLTAISGALDAAQPGQLLQALAPYLDWDEYFRYFAGESLVGDWDGYNFFIPNNFYLYHQPSDGKFRFMPWGVDQTCVPQPFYMSIRAMVWSSALTTKVVADAAAWSAFKQRLADCLATFLSLNLGPRTNAYVNQIRPAMYDDKRKDWTNAQFELGAAQVQNFVYTQPNWIASNLP